MDVYVVQDGRYFPGLILGIFSTRELAERFSATKQDSEFFEYRVDYWFESEVTDARAVDSV